MKDPPRTAAEFLNLLAEGMRLKASWSEADRAALRRGIEAKSMGVEIQQRIARNIACDALRPTVSVDMDDELRCVLIDATAEGLLRAAHSWESGDRFVWCASLTATVATVACFFDVPLLVRQGGGGAIVPDWFFSFAQLRNSHAVVTQLHHALRNSDTDDNRLRKNIAALTGGRSHRGTIDEIQTELSQASVKRRATMPLAFDLFIEHLMVTFDIDVLMRISMLSMADNARASLGKVSREELLVALRGHLFETAERLHRAAADGTPLNS